jgi:hypothetical protein
MVGMDTPATAWPPAAPDIVPGPWLPLSDSEAHMFLARLERHLQANGIAQVLGPLGGITHLRAVPLSFYPGWLVVSGEAALEDGLVGTFDVLLGPGFIWLMEGHAMVLQQLNRGVWPSGDERVQPDGSGQRCLPRPLAPLDATSAAVDYLRFYCNAVRSAQGSFHIVASVSELHACGAPNPEAVRDLVTAPHVAPAPDVPDEAPTTDGSDTPKPGKGWLQGAATMLYAGNLHRVELDIDPFGTVTMRDEHLLATDVAPAEQSRGPLRHIRPAAAPDAPTTAR